MKTARWKTQSFTFSRIMAVTLGALALMASGLPPLSLPRMEPFSPTAFAFEPNVGQAAAPVRYLARTPEATLYFAASEVVIAGPSPWVLRLRFVGGNPQAAVIPSGDIAGKANYFLGRDPTRWRTNVPTHAAITYRGLYPGIDLRYSGDQAALKGTYTIAPGADPSRIRWRYQGADAVRLGVEGDLQIVARRSGNLRRLTERSPVAWQVVNGQRIMIPAAYVVAPDGTVSFALGRYEDTLPLVIDPAIVYSTYLGGTIFDLGWDIAVDRRGNAYIAGYTASTDFPTVNPRQPAPGGQGEAFVAKFDPRGRPVYSTYLGGNYLDQAYAVAVDADGNAYVTGSTGSADFPIRSAFQPKYAGGWDAFVTKLDPTGNLVYSTYLGGSSEENRTNAGVPGDIAVDTSGQAYVTGDTQSPDFPVTPGAFDTTCGTDGACNGSTEAFVTKIDATGKALVYSTFLGGERGDTGWSIAVDQKGRAIVAGDTTSQQFPTRRAFQPTCAPSFAGCWDAFVAMVNPSGTRLAYATYLGGNDREYIDRAEGVAVDPAGVAYVTGFTGSDNWPLIDAFQQLYGGQVDAFVARFDPDGTLHSSTYLGGSNSEVGMGIAVDGEGGFHVAGLTLSTDFPVWNPLKPALGGFEDAFVTSFLPSGTDLRFSTYLGGSNGREEYGATGIGIDRLGRLYVTGGTEATDFPTARPYQRRPKGSYDAFIVKIDLSAP